MINRNVMRAFVLAAGGVMCAAAVAQQPMPGGNPSGNPGSPSSSGNPNNPNMPNTDAGLTPSTDSQEHKQQDMLFVHEATEGGMLEVQLGQLAAQKGTSPDVKGFGQKMVQDHTALNNAMKPIADKLGVKVTDRLSKKSQAMYDKMNALSGADFDKAYIEDMVKDHHKDLGEFTMEANLAGDPDLRALVQRGAVMIKEHYDIITKIAKDNGVAAKGH